MGMRTTATAITLSPCWRIMSPVVCNIPVVLVVAVADRWAAPGILEASFVRTELSVISHLPFSPPSSQDVPEKKKVVKNKKKRKEEGRKNK